MRDDQAMIWLILVSQLPRTPRVCAHLGSAVYSAQVWRMYSLAIHRPVPSNAVASSWVDAVRGEGGVLAEAVFGLAPVRRRARAGGGEAGHGALPDERGLELREGSEDVEQQPAAGGGGVQQFGQADEADATAFQLSHHIDQVPERPAKRRFSRQTTTVSPGRAWPSRSIRAGRDSSLPEALSTLFGRHQRREARRAAGLRPAAGWRRGRSRSCSWTSDRRL